MKNYLAKQKLVLLMLLLGAFIFKANGQSRFDKTSTELAKIKILKAKVEVNPADLKAHEAFINAFNVDDPAIISIYQNWEKRFPKEYVVPFAIGQALENRESLNAKEFLLQASVLKPDNAEVWNLLAQDALIRNDIKNGNDYLQKATFNEPKNPKYAFNYAYSFRDSDPTKYELLSLDIARKFPESEVAAEALNLLAYNSTIQPEKIAYYEQLYHGKFNQKIEWYYGGMLSYFDLLLKSNPGRAFELGLSMIIQNNLYLDVWHERLAVADAFLKARILIDLAKPDEALTLLNEVKLENITYSHYINAVEYLALFKAEAADAANQTQSAFDTLATIYSKQPTENLQISLYKYGVKLGKDTLQIAKNISDKRSIMSKQATAFSLQNYTSPDKTSLADYKGKVVLLTYWFPGCGPCRAEFPHFEAVLKKFNKNQVAYLGLNLQPSQDDAVLPFLKESGYSFEPLHDSWGRMKGNLPADGAPTNYLIDQNGRIVFSKFRIDADNEKTLELMIKELLATK